MRVEVLSLSTYLEPGEVFHFARTTLDTNTQPRLHGHDFYELLWVEQGVLEHRVNGHVEELMSGTLSFIRPGDVHALRASRGPVSLTNLAFLPQTGDHIAGRYGAAVGGRAFWSSAPVPARFGLTQCQRRALTVWQARAEVADRGLLALDAYLLALLTLLTADDLAVACDDDAPRWLVDALRAASSPAVYQSGVAALVEMAGRDPAHVSRAMRRFTGLSPSEVIRDIRMKHAARLLTSTTMPIAEIALECGLENLSHFYATFRQRFGMPPKAYRVAHRVDLVAGL